MASPCIFCGSNATQESYVHPKIKSWVLKPSQPYPMCDKCLFLNNQGDDNGLVDLIQEKWKRIQMVRKEEKDSHKPILQGKEPLEGENVDY